MNQSYLRRRWKMLKLEFRYHKVILTNPKVSKGKKFKHFFSIFSRRCAGQSCGGRAYLSHGNCAYVDELSNYYYCCKDCHDEIDAHYQELWDDYNSGRI